MSTILFVFAVLMITPPSQAQSKNDGSCLTALGAKTSKSIHQILNFSNQEFCTKIPETSVELAVQEYVNRSEAEKLTDPDLLTKLASLNSRIRTCKIASSRTIVENEVGRAEVCSSVTERCTSLPTTKEEKTYHCNYIVYFNCNDGLGEKTTYQVSGDETQYYDRRKKGTFKISSNPPQLVQAQK